MLKFIRKFQLVILAIGGSLLMVVFLLEPVLTSFQKSQMNRTVARLADGSKVTLLELDRARGELELARRVAPAVFLPKHQQGLGLMPDSEGDTDDHVYHWLLLSRMAEEAGLVGGAEDGRALIELELRAELSEAVQALSFQVQQGAISPEEAMAQLGQYETTRRAQLDREVGIAAGSARNTTEDDIWRALAKFTGAYRLMQLYLTAPAFSPGGAKAGLKDLYDSVAVNAAVIPGTVLGAGLPDPTEEQLQAFFEPLAGVNPAEHPDGLGYLQPGRMRLGWLVLDREAISAAVPADRVEMRKIWELDSRKPEDQRQYPGDFASERAAVERDFRATRTDQLMIEADRVIRAEVLRATRTLEREGTRLVLPEDWNDRRPRLDAIAEAIVERMREQGAPMQTPTVEIRDNTWLRSADIDNLPGVGRAFYRVGSRTVLARELPTLIDERGVIETMNLQVGVPQADPAAQDTMGNRYYLLVLEHRPAGPALSIEDAGRDRVLADYKSAEGFRLLQERLDTLRTAAAGENGVAGAIEGLMADVDLSRVVRPGVLAGIRVSAEQITPSVQARFVDPRLNTPAFRDAVLAAADGLDPLSPPEALTADPRVVAVALPGSRSVALARLIAPRPVTEEDFRLAMPMAIDQLGGRMMRQGIDAAGGADPFSFESLRDRFGLQVTDTGKDA
jgi:hypothetical protein